MKKLLLVVLLAVAVVACKKTNNVSASILVYNASWSANGITMALNGTPIIAQPIAQGSSSGTADSPYIKIPAGTNNITVNTGSSVLVDKNVYASAAFGNSFILFDTSVQQRPTRILQLSDDLSLPDTFRIKYRVLNLVPDTAVKVDILLVNGSTDSLPLVTNGSFAGNTVSASTLQSFTAVPYHGENYSIKIKKAGTGELYTTLNYPFSIQGIYSIIFSGLPAGNAGAGLKLTVLRHPAS
ncbi:MAG TPA: hypothetical protein VL307_09065 [Chitinophagaceae bacterium]|nr:hypothetical protein [Chitinophagaceae bacterium]